MERDRLVQEQLDARADSLSSASGRSTLITMEASFLMALDSRMRPSLS